ncbi:hypothetical protein Pecwa_0571 [Pectobacterium parmentieri WPP163]|nr:hypothetical protein Pecwa_0571 [Pectobacterium parmentieri WPP163]
MLYLLDNDYRYTNKLVCGHRFLHKCKPLFNMV